MRILFDENMNLRLRKALENHDVSTVQSLGWSGVKNGKLLAKAMEAGFDVLITVDNNLPHQQNLEAFEIAVIVLKVSRNRATELLPLVPKLITTLEGIRKGQLIVLP